MSWVVVATVEKGKQRLRLCVKYGLYLDDWLPRLARMGWRTVSVTPEAVEMPKRPAKESDAVQALLKELFKS